jgi:ACS family D-galactonate transporter-like MFS transporter
MASNTRLDDSKIARGMSVAVVLLVISVLINYIDRGNLSIAASMIQDELRISHSQLGLLLSAFFWTYASCQLISGWLVDRFNVNWVMAGGFLVWSTATAMTGLVHGLAALFAVRLLLGAGESVAYPSYSKIFANHLPERHRGFANSVIAAGVSLGPALGLLAGGEVIAKFGWRPFFIVLGLVSLLWLPLWFWFMPRGPSLGGTVGKHVGPGILEILEQRSLWGSAAGLFCVNYVSYFLIIWLPYYLTRERGLPTRTMVVIGALVYVMSSVFATICGWLSDLWIAAGRAPTVVRKGFMSAGMILSAIFLVAGVVASRTHIAMVLWLLAGAAYGVSASNTWAITQALAGPQAAGKWTGFQNFLGNMSGIVAGALTGYLLDRTGQFFWPFTATAIIAIFGCLSYVFIVGPIEESRWRSSPRLDAASSR